MGDPGAREAAPRPEGGGGARRFAGQKLQQEPVERRLLSIEQTADPKIMNALYVRIKYKAD